MTRFTQRAVARRTALAVAGVVAAGLTLAGCGAGDAGGGTSNSITVASFVSDLVTFDACTNWTFECQAVFEPLLVQDTAQGSETEPWLATEWEFNDDHTTLTLKLRDDVDFSDGEHFDAAAAKASWDYMLAGTWKDIWFPGVESVEATDEYTIEVHLSAADPVLLTKISIMPAMMSPAALAEPETLADNPVGTGPYLWVAEDSDSTTATFVRNDTYWNPDAYPFDEVTVVTLEDATARLNAVTSGQVDFAEVQPTAAAQAESAGLRVSPVAGTEVVLSIEDPSGATVAALGDIRVRQALQLAFDRQAIVDTVLNGQGAVTTQVWPEGYAEHDDAFEDDYGYDPEAAKELLADAGYADGFTVKLVSRPASAAYEPIIEQSLADIGITIEWTSVPDDQELFAESQTKQYALQIGFPAPGSVLIDNIGTNPFKWWLDDPEIGPLLESLQSNPDDTDLRQDFGAAWFEGAYTVVLAQIYSTYASTADLQLVAGDNWYRRLIEIQPAG